MAETHKITKANVISLSRGNYGIEFEFDDGAVTTEAVGDNETADWYASVQLGDVIPVGVNPLLLNAAKAEKLRKRAGRSLLSTIALASQPSRWRLVMMGLSVLVSAGERSSRYRAKLANLAEGSTAGGNAGLDVPSLGRRRYCRAQVVSGSRGRSDSSSRTDRR